VTEITQIQHEAPRPKQLLKNESENIHVDTFGRVFDMYRQKITPLDEKQRRGESLAPDEKKKLAQYRVVEWGNRMTEGGKHDMTVPCESDDQRFDSHENVPVDPLLEFLTEEMNDIDEELNNVGAPPSADRKRALEARKKQLKEDGRVLNRYSVPLRDLPGLGTPPVAGSFGRARLETEAKLISEDPLRRSENPNDEERMREDWLHAAEELDKRRILVAPKKKNALTVAASSASPVKARVSGGAPAPTDSDEATDEQEPIDEQSTDEPSDEEEDDTAVATTPATTPVPTSTPTVTPAPVPSSTAASAPAPVPAPVPAPATPGTGPYGLAVGPYGVPVSPDASLSPAPAGTSPLPADARYRATLIDRTDEIRKHAREQALREVHKRMREGGLRGIFRRMKYRWGEDYYVKKWTNEAMAIMIQNNNSMATVDFARMAAADANRLRDEEQRAGQTKIFQMREELYQGQKLEQAGGALKKVLVQDALRPVIAAIENGALGNTPQEKQARVQEILRNFVNTHKNDADTDISGKIQEFFGQNGENAQYFASDILEMSQKILDDKRAHGFALDAIEDRITFDLGMSSWGAEGSLYKKSWSDRLIANLKSREGLAGRMLGVPAVASLLESTGVAAGFGAVALMGARRASSDLVRAAIAVPGAGSIAGAAFSAMRRNYELKRDFAMHEVETTYGMKIAPNSPNREKLQKYLVNRATFEELLNGGANGELIVNYPPNTPDAQKKTQGLNELVLAFRNNPNDLNLQTAIMRRVAEIKTRLDLSAGLGKNFIDYGSEVVDTKRSELLLEAVKARKSVIDAINASNLTQAEKDARVAQVRDSEQANMQTWQDALTKNSEDRNSAFARFRALQSVKSASIGAGVGLVVGIGAQQVEHWVAQGLDTATTNLTGHTVDLLHRIAKSDTFLEKAGKVATGQTPLDQLLFRMNGLAGPDTHLSQNSIHEVLNSNKGGDFWVGNNDYRLHVDPGQHVANIYDKNGNPFQGNQVRDMFGNTVQSPSVELTDNGHVVVHGETDKLPKGLLDDLKQTGAVNTSNNFNVDRMKDLYHGRSLNIDNKVLVELKSNNSNELVFKDISVPSKPEIPGFEAHINPDGTIDVKGDISNLPPAFRDQLQHNNLLVLDQGVSQVPGQDRHWVLAEQGTDKVAVGSYTVDAPKGTQFIQQPDGSYEMKVHLHDAAHPSTDEYKTVATDIHFKPDGTLESYKAAPDMANYLQVSSETDKLPSVPLTSQSVIEHGVAVEHGPWAESAIKVNKVSYYEYNTGFVDQSGHTHPENVELNELRFRTKILPSVDGDTAHRAMEFNIGGMKDMPSWQQGLEPEKVFPLEQIFQKGEGAYAFFLKNDSSDPIIVTGMQDGPNGTPHAFLDGLFKLDPNDNDPHHFVSFAKDPISGRQPPAMQAGEFARMVLNTDELNKYTHDGFAQTYNTPVFAERAVEAGTLDEKGHWKSYATVLGRTRQEYSAQSGGPFGSASEAVKVIPKLSLENIDLKETTTHNVQLMKIVPGIEIIPNGENGPIEIPILPLPITPRAPLEELLHPDRTEEEEAPSVVPLPDTPYTNSGASETIRTEEQEKIRAGFSPGLRENPSYIPDPAVDIPYYLEQQRINDPDYFNVLQGLDAQVTEPMNPNCEMAVALAVAGHQEHLNIYRTLQTFEVQRDKAGNSIWDSGKYEVLLLVNWPQGTSPQQTLDEIKRFQEDYKAKTGKDFPVRIYTHEVTNGKKELGLYKKMAFDLSLLRKQKIAPGKEINIVMNDADMTYSEPTYLDGMLGIMNDPKNKAIDAILGRQDLDPEVYARYPTFHAAMRFWAFMSSLQRAKLGQIETQGRNTVIRGSSYAAIGGNRTKDFWADVEFKILMNEARNNKNSMLYSNGNWVMVDPRREVNKFMSGDPVAATWHDFNSNEAVRGQKINFGAFQDVDVDALQSDPEAIKKFETRLSSEINGILYAFGTDRSPNDPAPPAYINALKLRPTATMTDVIMRVLSLEGINTQLYYQDIDNNGKRERRLSVALDGTGDSTRELRAALKAYHDNDKKNVKIKNNPLFEIPSTVTTAAP
jgi:hypothetical protein